MKEFWKNYAVEGRSEKQTEKDINKPVASFKSIVFRHLEWKKIGVAGRNIVLETTEHGYMDFSAGGLWNN